VRAAALAAGAVLSLAAAGVALGAAAASAVEPDAILGTWLAEDRHGHRDAIVEIERRGDEYTATVVWVKYAVYPPEDPKGMAGQPVVDRENPDPALRSRPVLGIQMLSGLRFDGEAWVGGTLYSPREGSTYSAKVTPAGPDALAVRGYVGTPWLGQTVTWTRATPPS
jgi:uncharacterized protein (DUF2147 family)